MGSKLQAQFGHSSGRPHNSLRCLLGEVDEVYAAFAHRAMKDLHEGVTVHDVGTATLKLKSGAVATISNTCLLPEAEKIGLAIYTEQGVIEIHSDKLLVKEKGKTTEYHSSTCRA